MATLPKLSKEQMYEVVNALLKHMNTAEYVTALKASATSEPVPKSEDELIDRIETVQAAYFTTTYSEEVSKNTIATKLPATAFPLDGAAVLSQIRLAVKTFPDNETEVLITKLATMVENQLMMLAATVPQLSHLQQQLNGGGGHGHSHGGQPCNHQHGAPPILNSPQSEAMMKMAVQSLSPAQRETLDRVEKTMKGGSPPKPEDMREMFMIQQQIMAFMRTMEKFSAPPKKK
ncbi:hypothetical protein AGDE_03802 [Angomonas deanei]|uniref:Uncharacterized protein n=1 Tax=Angomonas deanei TaxID=59799 RepID=S9VNU3_9TRYP|nr:hypothetical protein AGDE_12083 [Angomonas deanei]EPY40126.1 hypothetical protein AGDE_03802 [Angomonas deanei]CAD2217052.1 hypothetical protein, conserved [Angomonas deanei]|eukprot:EPY24965.1 hypothetical protein AGDE_12083 [Angomonas deanei]